MRIREWGVGDAGCRIQDGIREGRIGNRGKGVGNAGYRRWKMERELGISRTYYFRSTKGVFKAEIMQEIEKRGHEVGYHYEVLDKAKGNYGEAMKIFEEELKAFRKVCDVKTICMHGNPLSKWTNKDVWDKYDFNDFDIIGEPYLSIDSDKVAYICKRDILKLGER